MGMKLPSKKPEKYSGSSFFNDGTECYFIDNGIWYTKLEDGEWIKPLNTNINYGKYSDFVINVSPNGEKIFINSIDRPIPEGLNNK